MNNVWNKKWKSVLVWVSGYLNFLALVLVGGFFYVKNEDEELQTAAKHAFIVTIIFAAISAFFSIFNYIGGLTNNYYSSDAYEFYSTCNTIVGIAKIIVYAVFVVLALVKKRAPAPAENTQSNENEQA
ncbi:MAG: hypothetical protein E7350_03145 [Clostridiales bacterium]|nr:hypothetical protein [Clostridiales bacterium]